MIIVRMKAACVYCSAALCLQVYFDCDGGELKQFYFVG